MKSKSFDIKKINTTKLKNKKQQTLRELQLTLLNSLAKNPVITLKKRRKKYPIDFDDYISKMDDSLNKYQLSYINKENDESGQNDIGPNEKYMTKDDTKLIKKIYDRNKLNNSKELSSKNEESNLKVMVSEPNYPNPYQSLGIIKHNNHIFNEISKDFLYRQSDLFNEHIKNIQKYEKKHKIKMPKISVGSSNVGLEIPVVDLTDNKTKDISSTLPHIPPNGNLKLLCYYKYPNKNFPEGREQFSVFIKNNEIIISGGISSNMKSLSIWSLNLEKLEWKKFQINGLIANRYGHTGIVYQNKLFLFGGKTKYLNMTYLCGLEIYSISDHSFNNPSVGKVSPETRKNHIAELLGNQMFIHGGLNESNEILNDCFLLTLTTLKWNICSIHKYSPSPKLYGHSSCVVIPQLLLFNHKFSIYSYPDLEPGKVSNLIKEKGIYIFGGKSKEEGGLSNQLWILITGKKPLEWV